MSSRNDSRPFADSCVVLGVTSSIAAYKAAELCSRLKAWGTEVRPVLTPDALEFIAPLTFETLAGAPAVVDLFDEPACPLPVHIELGTRADLIVVVPASADFIGRTAAGLADTALGAVIMAADCPVLFAPAMNARMFAAPAVQANLRCLEEYGYHLVGPGKGRLACGEAGSGRLAPLDDIVERMAGLLGAR